MTEPVAWRKKHSGDKKWRYEETGYIGDWDEIERLYTADQLHPRVKMTQEEFDEFQMLRLNDFIAPYDAMCCISVDSTVYKNLYRRIFTNHDDTLSFYQVEFSKLWSGFDARHPEETIEIVPDMKWFVRSKEKIQGFYMFLGYLNELRDPWIFTKQDNFTSFAQQFDTKEEAEKWTNPLTEAVQLPVEEK